MNRKGQMLIFGLMVLVMVVIVLGAMIPVFKSGIETARGSNGLNCVSTTKVCSATQAEPCYNASMDTETTTCVILDVYLPYIVIAVLLLGVSALMAGRLGVFSPQQPPEQYGGY